MRSLGRKLLLNFRVFALCNPQLQRNFSQIDDSHDGEAVQSNDKRENLNMDIKRKIKIIQMELEMERQSGNFFVPDAVQEKDWLQLVEMSTPQRRKRFFRYLKKRELDKISEKRSHDRKVEERREKCMAMRPKNPDHLHYGLGKNSMFLKIYGSSMNKFHYNNLIHALSFGQDIVIDLSYGHYMNYQEKNNTINQLVRLYTAVKTDKEPFHLHFCNADPNGDLVPKLKLALPFLQRPTPLLTVTDKTYLDIFPKEKLVYLSPQAADDLEYNHDDIYIIGGIVDKHQKGPVSLVKAKKEDLRMAKLPLDSHLNWGHGNKSLTLDQVMKIMVTMKNTMNWTKAFEHVPKRKLQKVVEAQPRGFPFRLLTSKNSKENDKENV